MLLRRPSSSSSSPSSSFTFEPPHRPPAYAPQADLQRKEQKTARIATDLACVRSKARSERREEAVNTAKKGTGLRKTKCKLRARIKRRSEVAALGRQRTVRKDEARKSAHGEGDGVDRSVERKKVLCELISFSPFARAVTNDEPLQRKLSGIATR